MKIPKTSACYFVYIERRKPTHLSWKAKRQYLLTLQVSRYSAVQRQKAVSAKTTNWVIGI